MTYAQLKTLIYDYLQVQGEATFVADIDQMIRLGEVRIAREVDTPDTKTVISGTLGATGGTIFLPTTAGFISPLSLSVSLDAGATDPYTSLLIKDATFLSEAYGSTIAGGLGIAGRPYAYAIFTVSNDPGDSPDIPVVQLNVGPIADNPYNWSLYYRKTPQTLVGSVAPYQTWISNFFPQALLYACLVEGYTFQKGDATLQAQYEKLLISGIAEMRSAIAQQTNDAFRPAPLPTLPQFPVPNQA